MTELFGEADGVEGAVGRPGPAFPPEPASAVIDLREDLDGDLDDQGDDVVDADGADEGKASASEHPESTEIELPEPPPTGDDLVDEAIARAARVAGEPPEAQVDVIEAVHRTLQDRLADVEA